MPRSRLTWLAVAMLATLAPDSSAQQNPMPPEEVAGAVLRADSAGDGATVVVL